MFKEKSFLEGAKHKDIYYKNVLKIRKRSSTILLHQRKKPSEIFQSRREEKTQRETHQRNRRDKDSKKKRHPMQ